MESNKDFIKFLGTAGARFVMLRQLRYSAGIWLKFKSTNLLIDPGPGSLLRCHSCRPKLDPSRLDGVILTHKHIDHSGDINVMAEAMTNGGYSKRGKIFAPLDALDKDGVIFSYYQTKVGEVITLKKGNFEVRDVKFSVQIKNQHSVETYGLKFYLGNQVVSYISDTKYFDKLVEAYLGSTLLILNVVFYQARDEYQHLCLADAVELVKRIKPEQAIFTHFGMTILNEKPRVLEEKVQKDTGLNIKFAYDGMNLPL